MKMGDCFLHPDPRKEMLSLWNFFPKDVVGFSRCGLSELPAWGTQHNVWVEVTFLMCQCGIGLKVFRNVFHKEIK